LSVQVSAFPAVELLWHSADRVVVRLGRYRSSPGQLDDLLHEVGSVGVVTASATELDTGLLTLHDAILHKQGDQLTGAAVMSEADLRSALPLLRSVTPVASGDGQLTLRGTATLFGVSAKVDATVSARNGALVVAPDVPLGDTAMITIFSDPHLKVQGIGASPTATGFVVRVTGRLR
jgi:hypothetical protein